MSTTLYLGDLSSVCTVADLEKEFLPFGALHDIRIATDPITGQTLYGFVDFKCKKSALRACGALNGKFVCGRSMR
jgi:RNA recognition motif-containing protein